MRVDHFIHPWSKFKFPQGYHNQCEDISLIRMTVKVIKRLFVAVSRRSQIWLHVCGCFIVSHFFLLMNLMLYWCWYILNKCYSDMRWPYQPIKSFCSLKKFPSWHFTRILNRKLFPFSIISVFLLYFLSFLITFLLMCYTFFLQDCVWPSL